MFNILTLISHRCTSGAQYVFIFYTLVPCQRARAPICAQGKRYCLTAHPRSNVRLYQYHMNCTVGILNNWLVFLVCSFAECRLGKTPNLIKYTSNFFYTLTLLTAPDNGWYWSCIGVHTKTPSGAIPRRCLNKRLSRYLLSTLLGGSHL